MADLISRKAVLEQETFLRDEEGFECSCVLSADIRRMLSPIDAVEVVRCEHCKWCVDKDETARCGHCDCPNRDVFVNDTEAFEAVSFDDFCSYGERKENER